MSIGRMCAFLLFTPLLHAQTFYTVAPEGSSITLSASATVRYGKATGCPAGAVGWNQVTLKAGTYFVEQGSVFGTDPCPGVVKELDVLETATAQTVTVNGKTVTVPALPVVVVTPPVTSTKKTCTVPAQTFTATTNSDGSFSAPISVVVTCK